MLGQGCLWAEPASYPQAVGADIRMQVPRSTGGVFREARYGRASKNIRPGFDLCAGGNSPGGAPNDAASLLRSLTCRGVSSPAGACSVCGRVSRQAGKPAGQTLLLDGALTCWLGASLRASCASGTATLAAT